MSKEHRFIISIQFLIHRRLDTVSLVNIKDITDKEVRANVDRKNAIQAQLQKMAKTNSGLNDVNVNHYGVKIGTSKVGKHYVEGELSEQTAKSLILLDEGLKGGSVNVSMFGGSVENQSTFKVTAINRGKCEKKS